MKSFVAFVVSVAILQFTDAVTIEKCDDESVKDIPTPVSFTSEGCVEPPCPLIKGTTSNGNITFEIPADTNVATVAINAKVLGFWVPFQPADTNVCNFLINGNCPLHKGDVVTYNLAIPVKNFYPALSLKLKIKILDQNNEPIMCMKLDCKVVKKRILFLY